MDHFYVDHERHLPAMAPPRQHDGLVVDHCGCEVTAGTEDAARSDDINLAFVVTGTGTHDTDGGGYMRLGGAQNAIWIAYVLLHDSVTSTARCPKPGNCRHADTDKTHRPND
eukprot:scaffold87865_cov64-Cyclotella_meneghiniana.AAC.9